MTPPPPNPAELPPAEQWPILTGPDCPLCDRPTDVVFIGPATTAAGDQVTSWQCRACRHDWTIPTHHWPVQDGPDCPFCLTEVTCWAALAPDSLGDLWTCEDGHEFVLTADGTIITPGNEDLSDWAPVWPRTNRDRQDGDAA